MNRILVLVEGDTEVSFVDYILCPEFAAKGIFLTSALFRKRHKGSFGYQNCQKRILNTIKQDSSVYVATFVDYYKLPHDWPGRKDADSCGAYLDKASTVEDELLKDITSQMGGGWNPAQFIPYVQMHEFEALLFSDTSILAEGDLKVSEQLENILKLFSCPEEINDNYDTCPSRRIEQHITNYVKTVDGILAAQKIGLAKMRRECPHFNEWITKLENLGN
ncbi:MAG: DUF4276 family protein [Sedimentisphaerales bacterium]|nr:DUF4276 family protein [Sedimentisphaerales bacterium]